MKVRFSIHFHTHWGQQVLLLEEGLSGNNRPKKGKKLKYEGDGHWTLEISLPEKTDKVLYKYALLNESTHEVEDEAGHLRELYLKGSFANTTHVYDQWRSRRDIENAFRTDAFKNTLLPLSNKKRKSTPSISKESNNTAIRFKIDVPFLEQGMKMCLSGNIPELGNWDENKAVILENFRETDWEQEIEIKKSLASTIEYKYGVYDPKKKKIISWEVGANRNIHKSELSKSALLVKNDQHFRSEKDWWKGAGVAIPVFSLRSEQGYGIGQFSDLELMADWAESVGLKLIQILPINDTTATKTWKDSYPYAAISVFALHPIYINPSLIGTVSNPIIREALEQQRVDLNNKKSVSYAEVLHLKWKYIREIYTEKKVGFLKEKEFIQFFKENESWLKPYAVFCYLRDLFGTVNFSKWDKYEKITPSVINTLSKENQPHFDEVAIHYFVQYHLYKQLKSATNYARSKGVVLKGDIPIGIYRHSVDAWVYPKLFNMNAQAGAPPDDYAIKGQNWGFPTYNWEEMAKDGYQWWQNRLKQMAQYFDAYRIDHILGFFRIWQMPYSQVEGIMGRFNPAIPIYKDEIEQKGVWLDYDRFCKPYIREHMLYDFFGDLKEQVKRQFLEEYHPGCYHLKEEINTQRKVSVLFAERDGMSMDEKVINQRMRDGLFGLLSEVIFFEEEGSGGVAFHPRNSLHFTKSYQELDEYTKSKINELYTDYFYNRQENFWKDQAMIKLPALKEATNMLVCGEDLGMVPACVPGVMMELGLLSLEIQRMPKGEREFSHPNDAPYLSVSSPSCHDMSTVRGWWEEDIERTQRYYNHILGLDGGAPYFCEPWICEQVVKQHLYGNSMWAIFPIQDLLAMDGELRRVETQEERINEPSNPNHYWKYRFHINLEDLMKQEKFNNYLKEMIKQSRR